MSGPPPTPTKLVLLKGNPGHRAKHRLSGPEPPIPPECPAAPSFLEGYACDEWYRVAPELHRLGLLSVVDVMPFAAYCMAFSRWYEAELALKKIAANDPVMSGLMIKRDNSAIANPLVSIARKSAGDMVRYAAEFGMTALARSRIAGGIAQPTHSKFDGLLR